MTDPQADREPDPAEPEGTAPAPAEAGNGADGGAEGTRADDASPRTRTSPRPGRWTTRAAVAALVLALAAAALAVAAGWRAQTLAASVESARAAAEAARTAADAPLEAVRGRLETLDAELASLEASQARDSSRIDSLAEPVDAWRERLAAIERRVESLQGGTVEARAEWLRTQAEHYLTLANAELELAGRWGNAVAALELADDRLRELAEPRLRPVRAQIADEVAALEAVSLPDVEGLALALGRLAERAHELPLRARSGNGADAAAAPEGVNDAEGVARLWAVIGRTLGGLVRIERRDALAARALTADERDAVRRALELEIEIARIALLRGQQNLFQDSLRSAQDRLERDFADGPAVAGAIELLGDMREEQIAPSRPDISGSLRRLRSLTSGGN